MTDYNDPLYQREAKRLVAIDTGVALEETFLVRVNGIVAYEGTDEREAMSYKTRCPYTHVRITSDHGYDYEWAG